MSHIVVWLETAEEQLAAAYLAARARGAAGAVTEAAARFEPLLRFHAQFLGGSRGGRRRLGVVRPLAVQFEVHDDERVVVGTGIRYLQRR